MSFYTIIKCHSAGMCAILNSTIQTIESLLNSSPHIIPKVVWDLPIYSDTLGENTWDTYFNLVGFTPILDQAKEIEVAKAYSSLSSTPRISLNNVFKNHIRVKPIITNKVDTIFRDLDNYRLIGVHLRNTDRIIEPQYSSPGIDKMLKHLLLTINEEYTSYKNIALYIASDNIPDAELIKKEVLVCFPTIKLLEDPDAVRSPGQLSVHGTHDSGLSGIANSKKAESILTDVFSLGRCDVVLRTCSNVTASSAIINLSTRYIDISKIYGKFTEEWVTQ